VLDLGLGGLVTLALVLLLDPETSRLTNRLRRLRVFDST